MLNTQSQFIRILQDECISKNVSYRIITSIYNLTYRTEIFLDGVLTDALEEECYYLNYDTKKDEYFKNKYTKVHQELKDKYCQKKSILPSQNKKTFLKLNKINLDYKKISVILLGFLLSFTLIFTLKRIMHTPTQSTKKEKLVKAVPLPDTPLLNTPLMNKSSQNKLVNNLPIKAPIKKESKITFEWIPKENLVLNVKHPLSLTFTNNTDTTVHIALSNRKLNESQYDEIVQFLDADIEANVEAYRTKIFEVYIEPTYYEQFEIGTYTGTLTFTLNDGKVKKEFDKHFSFQVK